MIAKSNNLIKTGFNKFFNLFFNLLLKSNLDSIRRNTVNPRSVQEKHLKQILKLQKNTEYGKKFNLSDKLSLEEFKAKHPLTNYENYRQIIEEIENTGEYTKLTAEPITLLLETSGTTGKSKLIPRTKALLSTCQKSILACTAIGKEKYLKKREKSRCLQLSTSLPLKSTSGGIPRGTGSSGAIKQASKIVKKIYELNFSSPVSVLSIDDYQNAYYCHLLFALLEPDLAYISANFASNVLEAMQILENEWRQLVRDIEVGKIYDDLKLDSSIRNELNNYLEPNECLAQKLKIEFERGFEAILPRIWTKMSYIGCITTGSMQIYQEKIEYYAGNIPIYSHGYGASESWIGVNLEPEKNPPAYTITPHAAFFEFIPVKEMEAENPLTTDLTSLKIGSAYEVVVTTLAGLYRYRIGDIIKCVGYYNKAPQIKFLYRRGSLLNLKGEKVSENTVSEALRKATKSLGNNYQLIDYTTTLKYSSQPWNYIFYVEINKSFHNQSELLSYRDSIEEFIRDFNGSYCEKRKANSIAPLELKIVKKDTFKNLKQKMISKGLSESQFKMPRLLKEQLLVEFMENSIVN